MSDNTQAMKLLTNRLSALVTKKLQKIFDDFHANPDGERLLRTMASAIMFRASSESCSDSETEVSDVADVDKKIAKRAQVVDYVTQHWFTHEGQNMEISVILENIIKLQAAILVTALGNQSVMLPQPNLNDFVLYVLRRQFRDNDVSENVSKTIDGYLTTRCGLEKIFEKHRSDPEVPTTKEEINAPNDGFI